MEFLRDKVEDLQREAGSVGMTFRESWPYPDMCYAAIGHAGGDCLRLRAAANENSMMITLHPAAPDLSTKIVAGSPYVGRSNTFWVNRVMQDNLSIIRRSAYRLGLIEERELPTDGALIAFLRDVASFHLPGETVHSKSKACVGKLATKIVGVARGLSQSEASPSRDQLLKFADLCWRAPLDALGNEPAISFIGHKANVVFSSRIPEALEQALASHLDTSAERKMTAADADRLPEMPRSL